MSHDPSLLKKTEKYFYNHFFKHDTLNYYTFTLHFYLFLSQLFWDVFLYKNTKFVRIYKTQSCWSVKTLENVSLYFCQLINHRFLIALYKISQLFPDLGLYMSTVTL